MGTDKRRKPRQSCNFLVEVRSQNWTSRTRVLDLSDTGMCISIERTANVWPGESVEIRCEELGYLPGRTRWRRSGRMGIEFNSSTDTKAKLGAYYKNFSPRNVEGEGSPQSGAVEVSRPAN